MVLMRNNGNGKHRKDLITCVQISKKTRNKLAEMGTINDTFEQVILNLMEKEPCGENKIGESEGE